MSRLIRALSLRQPWAALVVHGVKSVEIRSWPTQLRGLILIHASRQSDHRSEGWELVPAEAQATATLHGGLIGGVELADCLTYPDVESFAGDQPRHRNRPNWFKPPTLYGFLFRRPRLLPFRPLPGQVRFFGVRVSAGEWKRLRDADKRRRR